MDPRMRFLPTLVSVLFALTVTTSSAAQDSPLVDYGNIELRPLEWETPLEEAHAGVDMAFLDATFYADGEIPGRDMSGFPRPRIVETMERLAALPAAERAKVRFIHLNHTNPALWPDSEERREIERRGFRVAEEGERIGL